MKTILTIISAGVLFIATSCQKSQDVQPAGDNASTSDRSILPTNNLSASATSPTRVDERIVYFNNIQYAVQLQASALPPVSVDGVGATKLNTLYLIRQALGTATPFLGIVSLLPQSAYNATALWQVVVVDFTSPYTKPYQLTSADEIAKLLAMPTSGMVATKANLYYQMQMAPLKDQPTIKL
jgi:hypothetical protein